MKVCKKKQEFKMLNTEAQKNKFLKKIPNITKFPFSCFVYNQIH